MAGGRSSVSGAGVPTVLSPETLGWSSGATEDPLASDGGGLVARCPEGRVGSYKGLHDLSAGQDQEPQAIANTEYLP